MRAVEIVPGEPQRRGDDEPHHCRAGAGQLLGSVRRKADSAAVRAGGPWNRTFSARTRSGRDGGRSATCGSSTCCAPTRSCSGRSVTSGTTTLQDSLCSLACARWLATRCFGQAHRRSSRAEPGDEVTSADLAEAVAKVVPRVLQRRRRLAKIGGTPSRPGSRRGTSKRLRGREGPRRGDLHAVDDGVRAVPGPFGGRAGAALFDTVWAQALDQPRSHLVDLAVVASQRSLIDFRHSGGDHRGAVQRASSTDGGAAAVSRVDDLIANYQRFVQAAVAVGPRACPAGLDGRVHA